MKAKFRRSGVIMSLTCFTSLLVMTVSSAVHDTGDELSADAEALRARVEALAVEPRVADVPVADHWFLTRFYERRQFSPVWDSPAKLVHLLAALEASERHGLDPQDYHLGLLREKLSSMELGGVFRPELEIAATDALARLAFHLHFGKVNPEQLEPSWNFSRSMAGVSPVNTLQHLLAAPDLGSALEALAPQLPRYTELVQALATYREITAAGGWPLVTAGPTLRPRELSPRVAEVRDRLLASGDLLAEAEGAADDTALFDTELEAAVRAFQRRHGLSDDGLVGARTLAALNVPAEARVDQLRVNLERVRWAFRDLGPRYVIANIARFRVTLVEDGEAIWETRAVVGQPYRQTPVFRSDMSYLVFNPTWTVPPTILREDLLPELRRDPATLERRNMVLLDFEGRLIDPATVDWQTVQARGFPYMIRQQPGPDNALGRVKFMYPNRHLVYMHDTPARDLFGQSARAFSSGCVRLEKPLEFARLLLAETGNWDDAAINRVLADGRPRTVNLPRPLPVLTIYATAVPENGTLLFLPDIYSRDARLLAALNEPFRFNPPAGFDEDGEVPPPAPQSRPGSLH